MHQVLHHGHGLGIVKPAGEYGVLEVRESLRVVDELLELLVKLDALQLLFVRA